MAEGKEGLKSDLKAWKGCFWDDLDIKQNPAFGGICCSQLVLVTQTLPKKAEAALASNFLFRLPLSHFREGYIIDPFIPSR
jgi:hypothetical protein